MPKYIEVNSVELERIGGGALVRITKKQLESIKPVHPAKNSDKWDHWDKQAYDRRYNLWRRLMRKFN